MTVLQAELLQMIVAEDDLDPPPHCAFCGGLMVLPCLNEFLTR